jgi:hypothetical protein
MPKILGTSLEEYNKSCSSPHEESSKIEIKIFRIFYDFQEILQESAKSFLLFEIQVSKKPLKV